ncbi:MAG: AraC family transcriptional regulator [Shinella sp.]|nr:AraC family transcriptional regulator [Shinella sp.]
MERDRLIEYDAPVGALVVHPANVEGRAIWSYPRESLIVAIRPESLLDLATSELGADTVSLQPPPFGTVDLEALRIAELLRTELTRPYPATELYVDSLVTIFALHLLRNYSGAKKPAPDYRHGLSTHNAKRMRAFLEENFLRKLSIAELAAVADYSPFHFIRAFSKTFGQSPHQYVLNLRLAFAERLLMEGNLPVAEIAHLSGFSSQSHLTAMMRKYRHTTPAKIRSRR